MKKIRTDMLYALIAFESVLVAIASALWFPVWVLAIAASAFVFSTIEMIVNIVRIRRGSYDETKGQNTYRFPVWSFVIFAALLTCVTTAVILAIKMLFGYMLLAIFALVVVLSIMALVYRMGLLRTICVLLLAVMLVALISYLVATLVHSGVNLNPGLVTIPGDNIQIPGDDTQTPGNDTQTPGDDTQTPGNDTQTPGDDTQTPGDDTQTPGDDTQTPVVTPKIEAPATMTYGVPVSVKLEGILADNLKYGNKDFISIVKVSDSEVVLTLVGIVNDAGQVEIVPASGYITVTDSVSGTNVSIRIVEEIAIA